MDRRTNRVRAAGVSQQERQGDDANDVVDGGSAKNRSPDSTPQLVELQERLGRNADAGRAEQYANEDGLLGWGAQQRGYPSRSRDRDHDPADRRCRGYDADPPEGLQVSLQTHDKEERKHAQVGQ